MTDNNQCFVFSTSEEKAFEELGLMLNDAKGEADYQTLLPVIRSLFPGRSQSLAQIANEAVPETGPSLAQRLLGIYQEALLETVADLPTWYTSAVPSPGSVGPLVPTPSLVHSAPVPRALDSGPVTKLELLYYVSKALPDFQTSLLQLSQLNFDTNQIRQIREAMAGDMLTGTWRPIRTDLTPDQLSAANVLRERTLVFSQLFMSTVGVAVPVDSIVTSPNTVKYTKGADEAAFVRGVPIDPASADLMARWTQTARREFHFPYWPAANCVLGQLFLCMQVSGTMYGINPVPKVVNYEKIDRDVIGIVMLLNRFQSKDDRLRLNYLQQLLYERKDVCAVLEESYKHNHALYKKALTAVGKPDLITVRSQRESCISEITRTRRQRNQLLGALVYHRFAYPFVGNHDVHDNLVWRAILAVARKEGKSLQVIGVESAKDSIASGDVRVDHIRSDNEIVARQGCMHYFPGPWGRAKAMRVKDQTVHQVLEILQGCAHLPPATKILVRINLERPLHEPPEFIEAMKHWVLMRILKAGGAHSLDVTLILMKRQVVCEDKPTLRLNKLLNNVVQYASVANRWFNLAVSYGIITEAIPQDLVVYLKTDKTQTVKMENHPEIIWDSNPIISKPTTSVVAEKRDEEGAVSGVIEEDVEALERDLLASMPSFTPSSSPSMLSSDKSEALSP